MNSNQTIGRSHSRKHYHEQSMDDFMKNIKKFNLRSQRYISPKPLLYMYAKNNTTNTIEKSRSRTLSNHKSHHSKSKRSKKQKQKSNTKAIKSKLEKIFNQRPEPPSRQREVQNPANFIEKCGNKLKKAEKYLEGRSGVGLYLCQQFLSILNEIVEKMVKQLDRQLREIEQKTEKQIERKYINMVQKLQKKVKKMDKIIIESAQKADNNSKLLYALRMATNLDIDHIFGRVVLGTDKCGGQGYSKNITDSNYSSKRSDISENYMSNRNQMQKYLKNEPIEPRNQKIAALKLSELKDQINQNNQFVEKQSGRIRQAYDWERQAYDDQQRFKKVKNQPKYLITQFSDEFQLEDRQRKST